jgi:hypothetical protein
MRLKYSLQQVLAGGSARSTAKPGALVLRRGGGFATSPASYRRAAAGSIASAAG